MERLKLTDDKLKDKGLAETLCRRKIKEACELLVKINHNGTSLGVSLGSHSTDSDL